MGFLCQAPSHRVAFYPNDRLGNKGQRRGLWEGKVAATKSGCFGATNRLDVLYLPRTWWLSPFLPPAERQEAAAGFVGLSC
jgi:hypothetical protein